MTQNRMKRMSILAVIAGIALGLLVSWTLRPRETASTLAAPDGAALIEDAPDGRTGGARSPASGPAQQGGGDIQVWQEDPGLQAGDGDDEPKDEPKDEPEDAPQPEPEADADGDGTPDDTDNCPATANPAQNDTDQDGDGNACDDDDDNDGLTDEEEAKLGTDPHDDDTDGDGWQDGLEVQEGTNPNSAFSNPDQIDEIKNP